MKVSGRAAVRSGSGGGVVKRSEFFAERNAAGRRSAEGTAEFNASIARQHAEGIKRGGPPCCGTTGIWHQPWCLMGPWEPEEAVVSEDAGPDRLYQDVPLRIKFVKGNSRPVPEDPSSCETHTPSPEGYLAWWAWQEKKARTHEVRQCRGCGLWAVWEKRP